MKLTWNRFTDWLFDLMMKWAGILGIVAYARAHTQATGGTHDLQERYGQIVVKLKRKHNVVRNFFGRDYMGDPTAGAVEFPVRALDVQVRDYNVATGLALQQSATTYRRVLVTQHKGINEQIDGYEASAVPDNLKAQRFESGSYTMGREQELHSIGVLENGGTQSPELAPLTEDNAYESIVKDIARIKKLGVEKIDLVCVISDDTETTLLLDKRYANTASQLGAEMLREGITGKINGVPVIPSSNLRDDHFVTEYIIFGRSWAQTCEDWIIPPTFNNLTNEFIGSSALQGRMVFEDVLLDPTTCIVKRTLANVPTATLAQQLTFDGTATFTVVATYTNANLANDDWCVDAILETDVAMPAGTKLKIPGASELELTAATNRVWLSDIVNAASGTPRPKLNTHTSPQTIAVEVEELPSAWAGKVTVKTLTSNPVGTEGTYQSEAQKAWTYWHVLQTSTLYAEVAKIE